MLCSFVVELEQVGKVDPILTESEVYPVNLVLVGSHDVWSRVAKTDDCLERRQVEETVRRRVIFSFHEGAAQIEEVLHIHAGVNLVAIHLNVAKLGPVFGVHDVLGIKVLPVVVLDVPSDGVGGLSHRICRWVLSFARHVAVGPLPVGTTSSVMVGAIGGPLRHHEAGRISVEKIPVLLHLLDLLESEAEVGAQFPLPDNLSLLLGRISRLNQVIPVGIVQVVSKAVVWVIEESGLLVVIDWVFFYEIVINFLLF
mmetsp:Transcript_31220/g.38557  ORF Transcript_31220/g.38557 Transcript_31220/m.38557 type:complete len:255 (-) Transcript_31220:671-1435(-)